MRTPGRRRRRSLGIWPLRPAKRIVWFLVAGLFAPVVLVALTVAVSAALGWVKVDLAHFSGFAEMNAAALPQGTDPVPPAGLLAGQLVLNLLVVVIPNTVLPFDGW